MRDIRDAEGFVAATIERAPMTLAPDEREELLAEGLALLVELEREFDGRGRFSGYAARYFPGRLGNAWHDWHPEHCRVGTNGDRRWEYGAAAVSLEEVEIDAGAALPDDGLYSVRSTEYTGERLEGAFALLPAWRRFATRRMVDLAADGLEPAEIAEVLGVDRPTLGGLREGLRVALAKVDRATTTEVA